MSRIKIALLSGGWSQEREVSLKSGETVCSALDKEKYLVTVYDPLKDLQALIRAKGEIDLAVILLHGRLGEDGCIQGMLEMLKIPYMGSGVLSSAMAMNKTIAKEAFRRAGLKVARDAVLKKGAHYLVQEIMERLGSQTIVKPVCEGSTLGTSLCSNKRELAAGIERAFEYDHEVMVEEYINGREVTCCILGNRELKALPIIEIAPDKSYSFFDYDAKYTSGATSEICPAPISSALGEKVRLCARTAHRALLCRAWSRTDMIIRNESIYVLETNTIPGMTANSLFPLAARTAGLSVSDLVDELIRLSLELTDSGQLLTC